VLRKGINTPVAGSANKMPLETSHMKGAVGAQMFSCVTRTKTLEYLEWFYTSETTAAIGDMLGFTLLPPFVAKNVVQKMLKENYCLNSVGNPILAKAPKVPKAEYIFVSDLALYMLDAYTSVYREVDGKEPVTCSNPRSPHFTLHHAVF